ncbi:unnamed protein product, partial [Discosporangium mesarthrocarpum]
VEENPVPKSSQLGVGSPVVATPRAPPEGHSTGEEGVGEGGHNMSLKTTAPPIEGVTPTGPDGSLGAGTGTGTGDGSLPGILNPGLLVLPVSWSSGTVEGSGGGTLHGQVQGQGLLSGGSATGQLTPLMTSWPQSGPGAEISGFGVGLAEPGGMGIGRQVGPSVTTADSG